MKHLVAILLVGALLLVAAFSVKNFYRTQTVPADGSTVTGTFGDMSLNIELATTEASRELGLGNRKSIPNDFGMLFVFNTDDYWAFWMKDTLIPLDMFWLNDAGQVVYEKENVLPDTYPTTFSPTMKARYVLETNAGFGAAHGVTPGTQLRLQNGGGILQ
jgi:uncharacterized membrane protein (UPF0127 family)